MAAASEELTPFVREALERGIPRQQIEAALLAAGWPAEKTEAALRAFAEVDFPLPVPRPKPYLSAREAFVYLLLFTTLFLAAFNLGAILFELIERAFPDPAGSEYSPSNLRLALSFVLVSFPIYLWLTLRQHRELERDPAKRSSKVRKWLTYLTLFIAAGFLVGDVVTLIYYFLEGELSVRFLLKVLVVTVLAGIGFGYYLRDLRRDEREE